MFAYAGTYTVSANKVIHHVDISWNQLWTGTDQVRFYDLSGDTLVITANAKNSFNGKESRFDVTWQKVAD
jgi:Lipocalin-like domain